MFCYTSQFLWFFLPINSELVSSVLNFFLSGEVCSSLFIVLLCSSLLLVFPPHVLWISPLYYIFLFRLCLLRSVFINFHLSLPHHHLSLQFLCKIIKCPQLCFTALSGSTDSYYWGFNILPAQVFFWYVNECFVKRKKSELKTARNIFIIRPHLLFGLRPSGCDIINKLYDWVRCTQEAKEHTHTHTSLPAFSHTVTHTHRRWLIFHAAVWKSVEVTNRPVRPLP